MKVETGAFRRWAWLPIPILLAVMCALWAADLRGVYESPRLMLVLGFFFFTLASLYFACWIGKIFLIQRSPGLLLLGGGIAIWGVATPAAIAAAPGDPNLQITIHNTCVWLSALCQLTGVILSIRSTQTVPCARLWLGTACAVVPLVVGLVMWVSLAGRLPVFFMQGQGGSMERAIVLGSAIVMLVLTSGLLRKAAPSPPTGKRRPPVPPFAYWYMMALLAIAVGLFGVMLQSSAGGLLGWTGRTAQLLSGVYLLLAALAARRDSSAPLFQRRQNLGETSYRYGVAVATVLAATSIRLIFLAGMGTHAAFVTFFPAVILAALYGGLRAGILSTFLSAVVVDYYWLEPVNQFFPKHTADVLSLGVFFASCALINWLAEAMRLAQVRAVAAEAAAEITAERERAAERLQRERDLLLAMMNGTKRASLVYLDRDFNFVLVNESYAASCGCRPDDLIGKNHFALYPHAENEAIFTRVRDTGEAFEVHDKPFEFPDQPERGVTYWDWTLTPVKDRGGQVVGLVFSLYETTAHKRTEEKLRETAAELQAANTYLRDSRVAALNLMDDAVTARREAEQVSLVLRQREEQLRIFVEHAPAAIAMLDRDMRYVSASRRWLEDYGLAGQDVRGQSHYAIFPEIPERWKEIHRRSLGGDVVRMEDDSFDRADGSRQWLRWETRPWYATPGSIGGIVIFSEDVTSRKTAEQALRESEERYRSLFNGMTEGFAIHELITDKNGEPADYRYIEVNPAFERLTGLKREAVVGKTVLEVLPGTEPVWIQTFGKVALTGEPAHIEEYSAVIRRYFEVYAFRPAPMQFAVIFIDISERKRSEERIARLTRLYAVHSRVNESIVRIHDEKALFGEVCRIVSEVGGFPLVWIGERKDSRVLPAASFGRAGDYLKDIQVELDGPLGQGPTGTAIREGRSVVNDNFAANSATAPWREAALRHGFRASAAFPVRRQGKPVGALTLYATEPAAFDDEQLRLLDALSDNLSYALDALDHERLRNEAEEFLRRAAAELSRSNVELEQFAHVTSHDLKEPLRMVTGFMGLLKERYGGRLDADADVYIGYAVSAATRMQGLIDDLLAYARVGRSPETARIDLDKTLDMALANLQASIEESGAVVTREPLPTLWGNELELMQVFQNLIGNAIKFKRPDVPPEVHIRAEKVDVQNSAIRACEWRFSVRDNGIGIEPQFFDKLFAIFQRLHTREEYPGSGVGLAICKKVIERHGGRIWVESQAGKGSTFYFTLNEGAKT